MEEVERVSALIGDIYDASLDRALWPNVFDSIRDYMGARVASLGVAGCDSKSCRYLFQLRHPR